MQVRAAATRTVLIDAAARLIDANGLAGMGLNELLTIAGVSKGGLYFHFSSKAALLEAVRDGALRLVRDFVDDLPRRDGSMTMAEVANLGMVLTDLLRTNVMLRAGMMIELHETFERGREGRQPPSCRVFSALRGAALSGGIADLRPGLDISEVVELLTVIMAGVETLGRRDRDWWSPERSSELWRLVSRLVTEWAADQGADRRRGCRSV